MLTFAHPVWLLALPLAALPWLLAGRRVRPRLVVSSLEVWRTAPRPPAGVRTSPLRWSRLAAVQAATICACVLAAAGPQTGRGPQTVVLLDDSISMTTLDAAGRTRLDLAREVARSRLSRLPRGTPVSLMTASAAALEPAAAASVATNPDVTDRRGLERRLASVTPTDTVADLERAVLVALARADRVVVVSDRPAPATFDAGRIEWVRVGDEVDNQVVLHASARRAPAGGSSVDVLVTVRNQSRARAQRALLVTAGDAQVRLPLVIAAGSDLTRTLQLPVGSHTARVQLEGEDARPADDRAWIALPPPRRVRVGDGSAHRELALALRAMPGVEVTDLGSAPIVERPMDGAAQPFDLVVCGACPRPPSGVAALVLVPSSSGAERAPVHPAGFAHPVTTGLEPGDLRVRPAPLPLSAEADTVLLESAGHPALIVNEAGPVRRAFMNADLAGDPFVFTPGFPVLVANLVDWLVPADDGPGIVVAGEPVALRLPTDVDKASVRVQAPNGLVSATRRVGDDLVLDDTRQAGVYRVTGPGWQREVYVNPDVASSDMSPMPALPHVVPNGEAPVDPAWPLRALVVTAVGLLLLEARMRRRLGPWRTACLVLLVLVAAGAARWVRSGALDVVAVVDHSGSVASSERDRAMDAVARAKTGRRGADRLGVVAFARDAVVVQPLGTASGLAAPAALASDATDIAAALRLGRAVSSTSASARRLLLVSDGRATVGDAVREARLAGAAGVPVDVLALAGEGVTGPRVDRVTVPPERRTREPFTIAVAVRGAPRTVVPVRVSRNGEPFASGQVTLDDSGRATTTYVDAAESPGPYVYRASVAAGAVAGTAAGGVVAVSGESEVWIIGAAAGPIAAPLIAAGLRVRVVNPAALPDRLAGYHRVDAVVLDDVSAAALRPGQADALAQYVERDGGGLLLAGGPATLASNGYPTTALGPLLPVDLTARRGGRAPGSRLVLVVDKSGSMADQARGVPQIETARRAVSQVIRAMPDADALGVVMFDAAPTVIARPGPRLDAEALDARLRTVRPGGPTRVAPALAEAMRLLRADNVVGSRARVVLVTDGRTTPADAAEAIALARRGGIEIATVAVGAAPDRALLDSLASAGNGRAWYPDDGDDLARLVLRASARATDGPAVDETFTPRLQAHPVVAGLAELPWPALGGYVVSAARPSAAVPIASHLNDPVLAAWQAGSGRVAVLTMPTASAWAAGLVGSPRFGVLAAQLLRWLARGAESPDLWLDVSASGSTLRVSAEGAALDGAPVRLRDVAALVQPPSGPPRRVVMPETAPGLFAATLPLSTPGAYLVSLSAVEATSGVERRAARGVVWNGAEGAASGPDLSALRSIAAASGGRVLAPGASPFAAPRARMVTDASREGVVVALALFLSALLRHEAGVGLSRAGVPVPVRGRPRAAA